MIQLKIGFEKNYYLKYFFLKSLLSFFRHEFLNQYLGGSTIFMKAKRSLTSSFDQLMKRRSSKDDTGTTATKENSLPNNIIYSKVNSTNTFNLKLQVILYFIVYLYIKGYF